MAYMELNFPPLIANTHTHTHATVPEGETVIVGEGVAVEPVVVETETPTGIMVTSQGLAEVGVVLRKELCVCM